MTRFPLPPGYRALAGAGGVTVYLDERKRPVAWADADTRAARIRVWAHFVGGALLG